MRQWGALVLLLMACCGVAGCFTGDTARTTAWIERMRAPRLPLGPDGIMLDLALIERPLADPFLNEEVWQQADTQVAGLDRTQLLHDNGIRVGQVIGANPAKLQQLLLSERHCVSSRRQILASGGAVDMTLGPTQGEVAFLLRHEHGPEDVRLDQGQFSLKIEPKITGEGHIRLKFTPQVYHGAIMPDYTAASDRSGLILQYKRPCKSYPDLSWEVNLGTNQYLILGTAFDENASEDQAQSFGNAAFLPPQGNSFAQRILVLRCTRGVETNATRSQFRAGDGETPHASSPLVSPAAHCTQGASR